MDHLHCGQGLHDCAYGKDGAVSCVVGDIGGSSMIHVHVHLYRINRLHCGWHYHVDLSHVFSCCWRMVH